MQVQALRAIEQHLGLDALYVLGTNCVDNGPRAGLVKFLNAASADPDTVLHYEFMQARPQTGLRSFHLPRLPGVLLAVCLGATHGA